jgi:hypothetical protein
VQRDKTKLPKRSRKGNIDARLRGCPFGRHRNPQFGATSIQVARRLRAMLENLLQTLPEERCPRLRQELSLLQRSAERFFIEPEDRALADVSDSQGVSGGFEPRRKPEKQLPKNGSTAREP